MKPKKWIDRLLNVCLGIILLGILWLCSQVFLFASFRIPSESMYPCLQDGDAVLVWKPTIGARIFNLHKALNMERTEIYRLPCLRKIRRNDVLVFNFPHPNNWDKIEMHILKYYVKRCIGLPGDTLSIRDGAFRVNGVCEPLGDMTSQKQIQRTRREDFPQNVFYSFPYDSLLGWNIKDFGPLYIPKAGDVLKMDRTNYVLYRKLIEWEQEEKLHLTDSTVALNDSVIESYRFRKNYYFLAGDNCWNSQDSRYWGLLPEEYIVGKAARIWKSTDRSSGKMRWDRVWKKIE